MFSLSRSGKAMREVSSERGNEMKVDSLEDVLMHELNDLYSAEDQLVEALPQMAEASSNTELRNAFQQHLEETRDHRDRIQHIFGELGKRRTGVECEGMKGLIGEGEKIIKSNGDAAAKDAALIGAAQRVEHYEIAAYGTARTLAGELGMTDAETLLDQTLEEEAQADKLLTKIATGGMIKAGVNEAAR
jgi:ferritin-like metal-binding protein YciE